MADIVLGKDSADSAAPATTWKTTLWNGTAVKDVLMSDVYKALGSGTQDKTRSFLGSGAYGLSGGFPVCARLSLTTAVPVTTADVTAAGSIFVAPYKGNRITLFDSSGDPDILEFDETELALTATSGSMYDVFGYNNSGTLAAETLVWTNVTTRATALTTNKGMRVKTGDPTRLYLGSFLASGTNTTEDSTSKRYLWNYHHRVLKYAICRDTTNTWAYTTNSYRETNGGSTLGTSRVGVVIGWSEDVVRARAVSYAESSGAGIAYGAGVGIDNTSTNSAQIMAGKGTTSFAAPAIAEYAGYPGVGSHVISWLEIGNANLTFHGDNNLTYFQTGMVVEHFC